MTRPLTPKPNHNRGFSLGEVLISLIILATLAIYTIPKIIVNNQNNLRRALFKETLSTLSALTYEGKITGQLTGTNCYSYYANKLNAVKTCPTNSLTQGCWTSLAINGEEIEPGFKLHSGVEITGLNENCVSTNIAMIDINGGSGPNIGGTDIMFIELVQGTPAAGQKPYTVYGCSPATCGSTFYTTMYESFW